MHPPECTGRVPPSRFPPTPLFPSLQDEYEAEPEAWFIRRGSHLVSGWARRQEVGGWARQGRAAPHQEGFQLAFRSMRQRAPPQGTAHPPACVYTSLAFHSEARDFEKAGAALLPSHPTALVLRQQRRLLPPPSR